MTRPRPILPRMTNRQRERIKAVLVEFASKAQWQEPLYIPPWSDRDAFGDVLGEYGPTCDGEYARELAEWHLSIYGGGLWDPGEDAPRTVIARKTRPIIRPDAALILEWVRYHGHRMPDLQVCVALELYECGATLGQAAKRLAISRDSVKQAHRLLLRRYEQWLLGHGEGWVYDAI